MDVLIPLVRDGAGAVVPATVSVALVTADGSPVIGFVGPALATEYQSLALEDAPLSLALAPQSAIALPDCEPSYYKITITARHRAEVHLVQVPDGADPIDLRDLIAAESVPSASITAGLLLPDPADLPDARWLTTSSGAWIDTDAPPGSGIPDAPSDGTQYARQDGAWEPVVSSGDGTWGSITGTLADQTDLQSALDARALSSSLGTAASTDADAYATALQGSHGATAYGWGDHASAGYLTVESDAAALAALAGHEAATDPHPVYRLLIDSLPWTDVSGTPTTLAGYGITDAASAAQGALADSAVQPGALGTAAYADTVDFDAAGTGASQAASAVSGHESSFDHSTIVTAVQPGDLASVATSGAYADLSGTPTLGTAAATAATDYATAAQGGLAATALQPGSIDTLAELNSLVSDATLIDTGDSRLSNARTPTAHAASHATGGGDAITPADIGAEPAGVSAADITDSTSIGRDVLTAATKLAARTAIGEPYLPSAALQMGGTDQVISATAGTSYQITTPWATTVSADSSGAIAWNATEKYFDVVADCKIQFSIFARAVTASAAKSYLQLRDRGGAWSVKLTALLNTTYADHTSFGYIKDVTAGQRIEVILYCGDTTTYTVSSNTGVTSLQAQVLSINE